MFANVFQGLNLPFQRDFLVYRNACTYEGPLHQKSMCDPGSVYPADGFKRARIFRNVPLYPKSTWFRYGSSSSSSSSSSVVVVVVVV
ncbi:hypothetical protein M0802_003572 [Mischocyttarus mexicanus]|nr:hypothetical protein M0802_003572 [Mischocyttarus mexicanus]